MYKISKAFFDDFLVSYHSFNNDELLLKFQYKVLNTILVLMGIFTFLIATLSVFDIMPLGMQQTIANYTLSAVSVILIILLRGTKSRYLYIAYAMYFGAYLDFICTLICVPNDEFRLIWFYLLVFAAYITGGVFTGNIVAGVSLATILIVNHFYGLNLSDVAISTFTLSFIMASLFFRSYTKKITNFEKELISQRQLMISQSRFAAMGEMLSMIAHQWRQPLSTTTLLIAQERLKLMMSEEKNNDHIEILDKISDTMVYLSDTVDDFQTFFKPEKLKQDIEIDELIGRVQHFIQPRLSTTEVKLHIMQCKCGGINTYANELVQSIINILNNAIDVLIERHIYKPTISINFETLDDKIIIHIEDNGGGIEKEIINKIYEPYFSTKSKNGTGLGLYMSKMIIDQHIKGLLSVKNTKDGARFSIMLPKKTI
ncbi:sensor histidine kinase [Sulfurimonas sp.]|uniref:sensor histidine kinase n=1 Tax=Sulfurimonas sp. TaxID=2022749 RepID=UPI003567DB51